MVLTFSIAAYPVWLYDDPSDYTRGYMIIVKRNAYYMYSVTREHMLQSSFVYFFLYISFSSVLFKTPGRWHITKMTVWRC